jgi:uncharacterized protein YbjQ (UPF0145 family)
MTLSTVDSVAGCRVTQHLGLVAGVSVRSRTAAGDWLGGLRATFGGSQRGYEKTVAVSREEALARMVEQAVKLGADAIIGLRFDSGEFDSGKGASMNEVLAYGTAVYTQPL